MKCTVCAEPLALTDVYCPQCGTPTSGDPDAEEPAHDFLFERLSARLERERGLELKRLLGKGGQARVYLAYERPLDRLVAVKVLAPAIGHDPSAMQRLMDEGVAIARLKHQHIVGVYGRFEVDELLLLMLEYLPGGTLADRLRSTGPMPLSMMREITRQVGEAVQYAHDKGVVHRDLKPGNILFDEDGRRVVVSDFGLAKQADGVHRSRTRTQVGTPEYMCPEQWRGERVTPASDQYSLGVVIWEMVAGRRPFEGSEYEVSTSHLSASPPNLRTIRPDCPTQLQRVIERMMEKRPERRFASVREAVLRLDEALTNPAREERARESEGDEDPRRWRLRPWPFPWTHPTSLGLGVVALGLAAGAFVWSREGAGERPETIESRATRQVPPTTPTPPSSVAVSAGSDTLSVRGLGGVLEVGQVRRLELFSSRANRVIALPAGAHWVVNDAAVATLDSARARVTIVGTGSTQAVLWLGNTVLATRRITVQTGDVAAIDVEIPEGLEVGDSVALRAAAFDGQGRPMLSARISFRVVPDEYARVTTSGYLVGLRAGTATLFVTAGGHEDSRTFRVVEREGATGAERPGASGQEPARGGTRPGGGGPVSRDVPSEVVRREWEAVRRVWASRDERTIRDRYLIVGSADDGARSALLRAIRESRSLALDPCTNQGVSIDGSRAAFAMWCQLVRVTSAGTVTSQVQVQVVLDAAGGGWVSRGFRVTNVPTY